MSSPKPRILCVEVLPLLLTDYALTLAHTVDEGLRLAQGGGFDLYLLDDWLPDGSGIELCRQIRRFDSRTPVLFYSGLGDDTEGQRALAAGAQAYLQKPVDWEELARVIARLITEAAATRSPNRDASRERIEQALIDSK